MEKNLYLCTLILNSYYDLLMVILPTTIKFNLTCQFDVSILQLVRNDNIGGQFFSSLDFSYQSITKLIFSETPFVYIISEPEFLVWVMLCILGYKLGQTLYCKTGAQKQGWYSSRCYPFLKYFEQLVYVPQYFQQKLVQLNVSLSKY